MNDTSKDADWPGPKVAEVGVMPKGSSSFHDSDT